MVGEVHHRGGIGLRRKDELEGIVLSPAVVGHRLEVAGIAFLPIGREVQELYGVSLYAAFPNLVLEALGAAVKVVGAVVDGQGVLHTVQGELALGNAVGIAAGNLAGAGAVGKIGQGIVVSQHHVFQLSVLVRNHDGDDGGAHGAKLHIGTGTVLEGIEDDFFSARGLAPDFTCYGHGYFFL